MSGKNLRRLILVVAILLIVILYELAGDFLVSLPIYVKVLIFVGYAVAVGISVSSVKID